MRVVVTLLMVLFMVAPASARTTRSVEEVLNSVRSSVVNTLSTEDYSKTALTNGNRFITSDVTDLIVGGNRWFILSADLTGTKKVYLSFTVEAEQETEIYFYEDPQEPTRLEDTISIDAKNLNRTSLTTPDMKIYYNPIGTIISGDTLVAYSIVSGDNGLPGRTGMSEWVLSNDIGYMLYLKNQSSFPSETTVVLDWVEQYDQTN